MTQKSAAFDGSAKKSLHETVPSGSRYRLKTQVVVQLGALVRGQTVQGVQVGGEDGDLVEAVGLHFRGCGVLQRAVPFGLHVAVRGFLRAVVPFGLLGSALVEAQLTDQVEQRCLGGPRSRRSGAKPSAEAGRAVSITDPSPSR